VICAGKSSGGIGGRKSFFAIHLLLDFVLVFRVRLRALARELRFLGGGGGGAPEHARSSAPRGFLAKQIQRTVRSGVTSVSWFGGRRCLARRQLVGPGSENTWRRRSADRGAWATWRSIAHHKSFRKRWRPTTRPVLPHAEFFLACAVADRGGQSHRCCMPLEGCRLFDLAVSRVWMRGWRPREAAVDAGSQRVRCQSVAGRQWCCTPACLL